MKRFAIVLSVVALLLAGCGKSNGSTTGGSTWQEQYGLGVRYLSDNNYEEAVIAFTAAIEIDPKQPGAYNGAADAYIGLNDYEKANDILTRGQERCGDLEGFVRRLDNIAFLKSGNIGIQITDFYFDREDYLAGVETDFLVSVAYRCPDEQDCILMIGANTGEPDLFDMMDEDFTVTGSGGNQLHVTATPTQWEEANFGIYVNLSEAGHEEMWTPLAMDILYIDHDGYVSGHDGTNL